ncbi:unnamed protein product [Heterobilharzia americana]|nr:unnamed protein product [Heterobilharzia americana]
MMMQLKLSDSDICERRKAQLKEWYGSDTDKASTKMREPEKIKFPLSVQLLAACSNSDLDEFSRLLKLGTDINTQNADGLTSTHLACINVDFDFLKFLISSGANINLQDHEGWTPLHAAASVGCCELARFLIENGADLSVLSIDLELPIDVAQDDEMIKLLTNAMKKQGVDAEAIKHSEEQTLLNDAQHWLASGHYKPVVDPRTGATPLHVAACKDYTKAMEILLKIPGLDINAKDFDGWTPLHAAAHWNREASARMLANAGASFDEHTRASQSVFDVADKEIIVLLRQLRERQRAERLSNPPKLPEPSELVVATKRSHPSDLEESTDSESTDDDSMVEIDEPSSVSKKPATEQGLSSTSGDTILSSTGGVLKSTPSINASLNGVTKQERDSVIKSVVSRLSPEASGLQSITPPPQPENISPDGDDFLLKNDTQLKTVAKTTPSEEPPVITCATSAYKTETSEESSKLNTVAEDTLTNGNKKLTMEQDISNKDWKKTERDERVTFIAPSSPPPVTRKVPVRNVTPPRFSPPYNTPSSIPSRTIEAPSTEASQINDKTQSVTNHLDSNNIGTEGKFKTGIVSIVPAPRSKRSTDEQSSQSSVQTSDNKESSSSTVTTSTLTPGTGRTITKIIAVKPRRSDPQKMNSNNKDVKDAIVSVDNSRVNTESSSPVPEYTTNRRISVVMAPTKSGETETQRSVKARYVRSTRRSTQGVSSEDVEEAKKLVDKNNVIVSSQSIDPPTTDSLFSSLSNRTTPSETSVNTSKPVTISHTPSIGHRTFSDNANPLRRFTDADLTSARSTTTTTTTGGTVSSSVTSGSERLSARTDYSNIGRDTNNHVSSTGRNIISGDMDINSSTREENSPVRRQSFNSSVRSLEHSPTSESKSAYQTSGGFRERRHIRERNPPERILSSKSFSTASDVERRISDHSNSLYSGRSEYSPSAYSNSNKSFNTTAATATTNQNENDVKGIIQRPTSRFLHHQMQSVASNVNSSYPTYSWNPSSQISTNTTNNNNGNSTVTSSINNTRSAVTATANNHSNSTDYYSSITTTPRDQVSQWHDSKDYKRLYEKEKEEKERLQRELDRCNRQISHLRSEQPVSLRNSNDHGYSNSDLPNNNSYSNTSSQIPDNDIVRLREEISRMKEENGALIRVISKLSKPLS